MENTIEVSTAPQGDAVSSFNDISGESSSQSTTPDTSTEHTETSRTVDPGGTISFDELESIDRATDLEVKTDLKKQALKEAAKEKLKEELSEDEDNLTDQSQELDDAESKDEEERESKEDEAQEGEEQRKESKPDKGRVKSHKISLNGEEIDLPQDTVFKVKVDGQETEVSLQEALNSYSGHKAVDRRFTELNHEKNKLFETKKILDDNVNRIFQLAQEGKPQEALISFFKGLGVEPIQAMETLRNQFWQEAEKLSEMTPEERRAYEAELRAESYKSQYESVRQQDAMIAQQKEINSRIVDLQKAHEIDDETFDNTAEELLALKSEGKLDQVITPELIIQVALHDKKVEKATAMLEAINPDILLDENLDKVVSMMNSGMSYDEVMDYARHKWGSGNPAQVLSKKVEKNGRSDSTSHRSINPSKEDIWSFEQFDY